MTTLLLATTALFQSQGVTQTPILDLIARRVPGHQQEFVVGKMASPNGHDCFAIDADHGRIRIRGNTPLSQAAGFNWYMKHVTNLQITRRGDQLKRQLPLPKQAIQKSSPYAVVNFMNYCTYCYTAAFWSWSEWERELDLMAMSGVKTAIMPVGNEAVWRNVLTKLGYNKMDIQAFIPSCAYTTWWLMGNLEGEGGPVPDRLIDDEASLGKRIIARMHELGIEPILQGFCGTVPTTLPKYLPKANIVEQGKWAGGYQRPAVLSPLDPDFSRVARLWYAEHAKLYGKAKYYGGDLFHEGGRTQGLDLAGCARSVQHEMQRDNPQATWVLQGWGDNPPKRLLEATDPKHLLLEHFLSYPKKAPIVEYSGCPWTFTMINTFGGHEMISGSLKMLSTIPSDLLHKPNNHNVGIGIGDEGLDSNSAVYDLFADMVWQDQDVDLNRWAKDYSIRRYGQEDPKAVAFWRTMANDLLGHEAENLLCAWPRFGIQNTSSWGETKLTHDLGKMLVATRLLLSCRTKFKHLATYQSDCTEAMRQVLNDCGVQLYAQLSDAYTRHDQVQFDRLSKQFLQVVADCDRLFSSNEFTLLGKWISDARAKGHNEAERALLERSARQLNTFWTPKRTDLTDYAYRQWGGLMRDYYLPRWKSFLQSASVTLANGGPAPEYSDTATWVRWIHSETPQYSNKPVGNSSEIATEILAKHQKELDAGVAYWRAERDEQTRWQWTLANSNQVNQVLEWDVTSKLKSLGGGKVTVAVEYQSGQKAIVISKVELLVKSAMAVNGQIIATDEHLGRSGVVTKDNVFRLNGGTLKPGAQYLLRVYASGDGGNDSSGRIVIRRE